MQQSFPAGKKAKVLAINLLKLNSSLLETVAERLKEIQWSEFAQ